MHLALVHYKKAIQADYPNWRWDGPSILHPGHPPRPRTQKCEACDRGFGQMTAYYLHMVRRHHHDARTLNPHYLLGVTFAGQAQHQKYPHMEAGAAPRPPGMGS